MKRFLFVPLFALAILAAESVFAQCNSATGQCGAPSALSLNAQQQLAQLQFNSGVSTASAATSAPAAALPAVTFAQPAFSQQAFAQPVAASAYALNPAYVYVMLPAAAAGETTASPAPEDVAAAQSVAQAPNRFAQPMYLLASTPATLTAQAGGASASASAASAAPAPVVAAEPIPVNVPTAAASSGCSSCNSRARVGSRVAARLAARPRILGRSSTSIAISRSRSR